MNGRIQTHYLNIGTVVFFVSINNYMLMINTKRLKIIAIQKFFWHNDFHSEQLIVIRM